MGVRLIDTNLLNHNHNTHLLVAIYAAIVAVATALAAVVVVGFLPPTKSIWMLGGEASEEHLNKIHKSWSTKQRDDK